MAATKKNSTSSESVTEMIKGSHEFKLKGYSLLKGIGVGKFIASETFNVGGYEWAIYFYPDGVDTQEHATVYVSVFVVLVSNANDVRAMFEFAMHDQRGQEEHFVLGHFNDTLGTQPHTLSKGEMWGIQRFYNRFHLEHSMYLIDDCLQVNCTVGVLPTIRDNSMTIELPESTIATSFGMLFEDEQSSDVTFCVGGNKFYAHKIVLAARSSVFKSQFFCGTDKVDREILVNEMEPKVFKALLHFIYKDTLIEDEELHLSVSSSMASISEWYVTKLLAAAHKYDLPRLKLMCESVLCKHISIGSVAEILVISDCYDATELKFICLQFSAENLNAVLKSNGFKHLKEKCPHLQLELLETVAAGIGCVSVDSDATTPEPNEIEAENTSYYPSSDEENHLGW
ncbi:BTB/POZ and MATH domain-containing protein 4-like [Vigna radiata var. radiata]|uniref:BTB/POZ and MATH domain-containing protein 4-like n=1 Tax=Vigna radiata var. radiata TaxID=3916 RepID=A0A1S3TBB8_VIGRR|nr:BTB/POZ and MATH domain-containing protein 4-like [Vigna radiata var. radiata]